MTLPAVSVITVYNDEDVLERRLRAGLDRQRGMEWELIAVDNRDASFESAVAALESGATRARGRWMVFAHQDVELLSDTWLSDATADLEPIGDLGWAGAAGVDHGGRFRGLLVDAGMVRGVYTGRLEPVMTLDECLMVTRRRETGGYFDADLEGWHVYGVDACLSALRDGLCNVALPFPVRHDSRGSNLAGLQNARRWILAKHGAAFDAIQTTTGTLPEALEHPRGRPPTLASRLTRRIRADALRAAGWRGGFRVWLGETLEEATRSVPVDVFRPSAPVGTIEARGFVHQPTHSRSVRHLFGAGVEAARPDAARVIWHDRIAASADSVREVERLARGATTLVVVETSERRRKPGLARALRARASERTLAVDLDGRRLAIYRVEAAPS